MATAIEITDAWGRQIVQALIAGHALKTKGPLPEPLRIEHPDRPKPKPEKPKKKRRLATPADVAALMS